MRVIAELPHPECKISIFSMNQKYIVKFEQGTFEQSYKLAELDLSGAALMMCLKYWMKSLLQP